MKDIEYSNNYYDTDFYFDDTPKFYDKVEKGFNDYPPDIVDLVGWGLAGYDMFDDLGSTRESTGYERLIQSMRFILDTPLGTRFFLPSFGSRVREALFQPNDYILRDLVEMYARDAIKKWEPRVIIDHMEVTSSKEIVEIEIQFHAISNNSPQSFIYRANRELHDLD